MTLSPAYDVHAVCENFSEGRENLIEITSREAGGKGVNISRALLSAGIESKAIVLLGKDNSTEYERALSNAGLDHHTVRIEGKIRENLTIHSKTGETRISQRGFKAGAEALSEIEKSLDLKKDDLITVTGRLPDGISTHDIKELLKGLKKKGALIVIDSKSFTKEDIDEVNPWLIKPNREEISAYIGKDIKYLEEARDNLNLISKIKAENILITLDADGAALVTDGKIYTRKAPSIDTVSTIGAGDSAIAGFIASKIIGENAEASLKRAVAFGSAAALTEGSNPPKIEDIKKLIKYME